MFPQIFGKYVLERLISVGGMARVFLATLRGAGGFEKKLVVKQIRAELATDEAFVKRFVDEAKTTVELSHPNIVPVYELGVEQGVYYLAMEFCDGVTLAELVHKTGKLSPAEGAYVGIEICRALDYAHRKARIIHRDVTPRNVIVDEEGGVRLIDFGIAAPAFAGAKEVFGSPGHMPPEQLTGGQLGPPTDVFAAAALLYEAWSAAAPFRRETPEASERALSERVPVLSTIDAAFAPLDDLIASSLSRDAAARPQSAEELSRPLRRFLNDADLGDLAKKLGARVVRLRAQAPAEDAPAPSGDDADRAAERASSPDVTRTFAIRSSEADATDDPAKPSAAPEVSTRRMRSEHPGASTAPSQGAPRPRRNALWAAGALLALTAGASGVVWQGSRAQSATSNATPSAAAGSGGTEVSARDESADASAKEAGEGAGSGGAASSGAASGGGAASSGATSSSGANRDNGGEGGARGASVPRAESDGGSRGSAGDTAAHLKILANPQATVEIDGRPRGAAPIADLVVAPGTHFVRLDCAPLGEAVSQNVRIEPGESVTISGDFTGAHGRILVRRSGANP